MSRGALLAAALALLLALSGCSGGTRSDPLYPQILAAAQTTLTQGRAQRAAAARPPLTRAVLDEIEGSYIEVTLERSGLFAYLFVSTTRPGGVVQWRTEDDVTLTMRQGVLIATRGLGGDLVSSAVATAPDRLGPAGGGERVMFIRTGDLEERRLGLACALQDLGPATITIVEQAQATRHLQERCTTPDGGEIVNDYWTDARQGLVWQSRQWAGPHIGYLRIRRLTTG